jgi:hypothetical protein
LKKWIAGISLVLIVVVLYYAQYSKIGPGENIRIANLDELEKDSIGLAWEPFYRVRATIIDGRSAHFIIPESLEKKQGNIMELTGSPMFYGNGCRRVEDSVTITEFFLVPSPGIAEACELQPDLEMRWTIRVHMKDSMVLHYEEMIDARIQVKGIFRIDTSKPYDAAFYLDDAVAQVLAF